MRAILTVATGPVVILAEELSRIDGIEAAFLYGSLVARMLGEAGPTPHDRDVMVLGEPRRGRGLRGVHPGRCEARPVGAAATEKAVQVARTLVDAARARGLST